MSAAPHSARLVLPAIHCLARLGVSDGEAATPQPVLVFVTLSFSSVPAAVDSDALAETVDYAPLVEVVASASRSRRFRLLESLARDIHVALRAHLGPDLPLWVEVEKVRPQLPALRQGARFGLGDLLGADTRCSRCDAPRAEPVIRRALPLDCDRLRNLIETSARASTRTHYSTDEIAGALEAGIWGVDQALVRDGTCYVVEVQGELVATGSWSRRTTFFGSDATSNRATETLDPATDSARLRAFFVHPEYSGRGFGTALLRRCELEADRAGFRRLELVATLSGEGFYRSQGFVALEPVRALLPRGGTLTFVRMAKHVLSVGTKLSINIDVDDLDKAVEFYTSAVGLRPVRRFGGGVVQLAGAGVPVYLLQKANSRAPFEGATQRRTYGRHWTPLHLDFIVEDLEAAVERAIAAGAIAESPIASFNWGKMALMADPFGHGFCLLKTDEAALELAASPYVPSANSMP